MKIFRFITFTIILILALSAHLNPVFALTISQPKNIANFQTSATIANGATVGSVALPAAARGEIVWLSINCPDLTGTTNLTLYVSTSAHTASPMIFYWSKASIAENAVTCGVIGASGNPNFVPLPQNQSSLYFILKASGSQSGAKTIYINYAVWRDSPIYTLNTKTLVIADTKTSGTAEITSLAGEIICGAVSAPSTTSSVATYIYLSSSSGVDSNYLWVSGSCASNTVTSILDVPTYYQFLPIAFTGNADKSYWQAIAAGAQTGAKTYTLYYVVKPKPF